MDELLIPFGIDKTTEAIVEPEDAARGRACNCKCPMCGVPLMSRHPEKGLTRKHFAHDTRNEQSGPKVECPLTSSASVAMMLRHVANKAIGHKIYTPAWNKSRSWEVTLEARNLITGCTAYHEQNGIEPDLVVEIGKHKIAVELKYTGRGQGKVKRHSTADYSAVLYIDCDQFDPKPLRTNSNLRFSDAALEFLLGETGKKWTKHPREKEGHPLKRLT